jgi:hypothetical protein
MDNKTLEKRIANKLIKAILERGYSISVNDGEETTLKFSKEPRKIATALFTTDEDYLLVYDDNNDRVGWVLLIGGNGSDLISDWNGKRLDEIIDPVLDYINDKLI